MAKRGRGPGRPFEPGKSGNPNGRPKGKPCLTELLRASLAEREFDGKRTKAQAVVDALIGEACAGKTAAIQQIFDRVDGLLQPTLQDPTINLEAVAWAMKRKYESIRPDGPFVLDQE